jgi:transposase InsO family protein
MDLRDAMQRIALQWPSYGRPTITAELKRQGWQVGPNRVRRLMIEDNLLCVRKRKFVVTTDSNHGRKVYPNLASEMQLDGLNQLWVADITYIRLETEFVYLAVVIDAFSRQVIGWALDRTLEDDLPLQALRMAFEQRQPASGLVHHSDRGSRISMSHKASPWENGGCESRMKTLKYEEVLRQEYRNLAEARSCLERFIEKVYNHQRLHSAIGHRQNSSRNGWRRSTQEEWRDAIRYSRLPAALFGRKQRRPLQGNPASDRIPRGPGCNRHSRICAAASASFTGLPRR